MFPIKLPGQVANGSSRSQKINLNNLQDDGGNRRLFFIFFFMCRGIEDRVLPRVYVLSQLRIRRIQCLNGKSKS